MRGTGGTDGGIARGSLSGVQFPTGWRIEMLTKSHNRRGFRSGQEVRTTKN